MSSLVRGIDFGRLVARGPHESLAAAMEVALAFPRIVELALPWAAAWIAAALIGSAYHPLLGTILQVMAGAMMCWRLVRACAGRDGQSWHPDQTFAFMLRAVSLCGAATLALIAGIVLAAFVPGLLALAIAALSGTEDGAIPPMLLAPVRLIGLSGGLCAAALILSLGSDWVVRVALQTSSRDPFPQTIEHLTASLAEILSPDDLLRRWRAWLWRVMVPFAVLATAGTQAMAGLSFLLADEGTCTVVAAALQALVVLPAGLALAASCAERTLRTGLGGTAIEDA